MQGLRVGCLFRILFLLKPNITSDIINSEEFLRFLFYFARYLGQFTRNYTQTVKRGLLTTN